MDAGLLRSVWPTPGRSDYAKPATSAASAIQEISPSKADEAAFRGEERAFEPSGSISRIRVLQEGDAAREKAPPEGATSGPHDALEDIPDDLKRLMDKLATPLRTLMGSDRIGEDAKRALAHALTSGPDTDRASNARTNPGAAPIDAEQRYEEMKATVNAFHAALKKVFRIEDDVTRTEPLEGTSSEREKEEQAGLEAGDRSIVDDGPAERTDSMARKRRDLLLQPSAAARGSVAGEKQEPVSPTALSDQLYSRLAAMYAAPDSPASDRNASLNTEG